MVIRKLIRGWIAGISMALSLTQCPALAQSPLPHFVSRVFFGREDASALMKQAAKLESEGQYEAAAGLYDKAASAFKAENKTDQQTTALKKSAEMYEKVADQLTAPGKPVSKKQPDPVVKELGYRGFHVGDAVDEKISGKQYPAWVVEIDPRGGENFSVHVHYTGRSPSGTKIDTWEAPNRLRHPKAVGNAGNLSGGPLPGRYKI